MSFCLHGFKCSVASVKESAIPLLLTIAAFTVYKHSCVFSNLGLWLVGQDLKFLLLLEHRQRQLPLDSSVAKNCYFPTRFKVPACSGTISPSASCTLTKALSLHLFSAIDLESPLCGDLRLSPLLNAFLCASLSSSTYLSPSRSPSLVLSACILTKCALFLPA